MSEGKKRLWTWFSLSYASFLILPRAGMHQMPDEWQNRMAELLEEWDEAAKNQPPMDFFVQAKEDGKFCAVPEWIRNYRHPDWRAWDHFFGRVRHCTYPDCHCPFDMGPDHQCLKGLPVIRK